MKSNLERKIEQAIKVTLDAQRGKSRDEALIKMAQGKAPFQLFMLKVKYAIASFFTGNYTFIFVITIFFAGYGIFYFNNSKNEIIINKSNFSYSDEFKIEYEKALKVFNYDTLKEKTSINMYTNQSLDNSIFKLEHWEGDFPRNYFDSDTIFIGDFIDTNLVLIFFKSDVKKLKMDGFEYNIDPIDTLYSNNIFKIYKQTEIPFLLKEEKYPSSTKSNGTPGFIKHYLLYRKDYYIFVIVFNPNNSEGYIQIETNNGYFMRKKVAKTSNLIIDAVKIKISEIDSSFSIRGFMKNERSELHLTSGTTWGPWIKIYE